MSDGDDLDVEEEGLTATTNLSISLNAATSVSAISFDASAGLRKNLSNGSSDVQQPRLRLTYGRENLSSAVDLDLEYRERDVDTLEPDDDLEDIVRFSTGTREDMSANLGFVFGRDAPFGGGLDLGYRTTRYADTSDPDLVDGETVSATGTLTFVIDPRITALLRGTYSDTDEDAAGRDVLYENISAGARLAVTPTLSTDIFVGYTRTTETEGGIEDQQEGASFELSFTEERLNGAWTGSFVSDLNDDGERRSTVRINRSLDLPRGALDAGFGLSQGEDGDLRPLYSLAYLHERPTSRLNLSLDQAFTTDDNGDEALNSRLSVSYNRDLTELSSLQAAVFLRSTDYLGGSEDADRQIDLNLSYRHSLAEDWGLVAGYTHRIDSENDTTERSNEIFLSIEKSFWRRF
ncbi:hypothetical protein [Rhodovulum marinum]|uniref:hypothetical protein n=1 Tax=Rhodovulum marinum TaxID=320662 RepID=UPI00104832E2|nr:hypothetical protein [Rhodovulum marinum]